jgi:methionyl-tRNA synthetase
MKRKYDWSSCPNCGGSDTYLCKHCQECCAFDMIRNARSWIKSNKNNMPEIRAISFLYGEQPEKVVAFINKETAK